MLTEITKRFSWIANADWQMYCYFNYNVNRKVQNTVCFVNALK